MSAKPSAALRAFEAILAAAATVPAVVVVLAPLESVALGVGVFAIARPGSAAALARNGLSFGTVRVLAAIVGAAFAALVVAHLVRARRLGAAARARSEAPPHLAEVLVSTSRLLAPLLALPFVVALSSPGIEAADPVGTLVFILLVAGVVAFWMFTLAPSHGATRDLPRGVAIASVAALWAGYTAFFSWLSIQNHHALDTRTVSLGFYDNIFFQSAHGHPLGSSLMKSGYHGSAHFDPILVMFAPIYLLAPRAETLLVLQSLWLGAGVVPLYLLARAHLATRLTALAIAAMFALHPALHGANLYEFHSLTLAVPLVLWLLYFLETDRARAYAFTLLLALLVREDMPFLLAFVGIYALRSGRRRLGAATLVACAFWFVVVKRVFMASPDVFMSGENAYSFAFDFDEMMPNHDGASGFALTLVTNPAFVLRSMLSGPKLVYLATMFLPLAFLPFLAKGRVMLAWGLVFSLLATRPALFGVYFHYPCFTLPIAFALVPEALARIESGGLARIVGSDGRRARRAFFVAALVASALASWKFGGLVENQSFRAGYLRVARTMTADERANYAWLEEQTRAIPNDALVGITNTVGPHVSNRMVVRFYPEHDDVDWLVLDLAELSDALRARHEENVRAGFFELVSEHGDLAVYRRK